MRLIEVLFPIIACALVLVGVQRGWILNDGEGEVCGDPPKEREHISGGGP
jgi:hypothetical protein